MGSLYFFDVLTILTNALFAAPVVLSWIYGLYMQTVLWIVVFVASMLYHLCFEEVHSCVADPFLLESIDTVFAMTGFFVCVLMLLYFMMDFHMIRDITVVLAFHCVLVIIVIITGSTFSIPSLAFTALFIVAFIAVVVSLFLHRNRRHKGKGRVLRAFSERVDPWWYVSGLFCGTVGLAFFPLHLLIGDEYYPVTHSFWHIFLIAGISLVTHAVRGHRGTGSKK